MIVEIVDQESVHWYTMRSRIKSIKLVIGAASRKDNERFTYFNLIIYSTKKEDCKIVRLSFEECIVTASYNYISFLKCFFLRTEHNLIVTIHHTNFRTTTFSKLKNFIINFWKFTAEWDNITEFLYCCIFHLHFLFLQLKRKKNSFKPNNCFKFGVDRLISSREKKKRIYFLDVLRTY